MSFSRWKKYKLGELADITSSKRIFLSDYTNAGIPFYRSKEIIQKSLGESLKDVLFISEERFFEIKNKYGIPQDGDILISAVGERAGIPYVVKNDGNFYFKDGNLIWLKQIDKKLNSYYLYHWIKSNEGKARIESLMIGSAQKALTIIALKQFEIFIPEIKTQERIASILSCLDDKIELNQQTNKTLEAIAQAIFKEMCLFKGDKLPEGWRIARLGDVCNLIKGVSYRSNELVPSKLALVTLKSMNRGGGLNFRGFKEFDGKYKNSQILEEGDVVIAQTDITQNADIIGCPAIVENPYNYEKLIASIDLVKCQSKDGELTNEVLFFFLQNSTFKDFCLSHTNGSTVLHLRSSELASYEFVIPNKKVLGEFHKLVKSIRENIINNNKKTQSLIILRDSLLPKLMKGEIQI
ncbi:restriction endonuclease subunit S [Pedobacter ginsenosidimutans]|uniref:restriction endonuclease subunit S n=1 Tax=Pedobacter ginsenosidimutans TaxID=687842 RepID=UPI0009F8CC0A|nr:restriction endonuclease subunit S [Pedobacter ginsenosidimutans]